MSSPLAERDRERAGRAAYLRWSENHTYQGHWHELPDWYRENFKRLADAIVEELGMPPVTARVVRIEHQEKQAG